MLTAHERSAIIEIASHQTPEMRDSILHDIEVLEVSPGNDDRSIINFSEKSTSRHFIGQRPIGPEGRMSDRDGGLISAILYVDSSNRLIEFELIKEDGGPVVSPQWESFVVESYD